MKPLVSVLMLTYNHEKFIERSIKAVLNQEVSFKFEVIIADDASKDNNQLIIQEYLKKSLSVKAILRKKNIGVAYNWLEAFNHCNGKYITFCEGDDFWNDPYKLQKQVDFLEKHQEFGMVYTDIYVINDDGAEISCEAPFLKLKRAYKEGYIFWDLLENNFIPTVTVCARRDLLNAFIKRNEKLDYIYDMWLWLNIALTNKVKFLNEKTATYRKHAGGITAQNNFLNEKRLLIYLDIIKKVLSDRGKQSLKKREKEILFKKIYELLRSNKIVRDEKRILISKLIKPETGFRFIFWLFIYVIKRNYENSYSRNQGR